MFKKSKKVLGRINTIDDNLQKLHYTLLNNPSPVKKHLAMASITSFSDNYELWRYNRINKLLEIFGIDFFRGKKILELGGGHGDLGAFFADLGSKVTCLEGRIQNCNIAKLKWNHLDTFECHHHDLETDFRKYGTFDLIINTGVLYHIKEIASHLSHCIEMSNSIIMETEVCDSLDDSKVIFVDENQKALTQAVSGTGSRPSPTYIEKFFEEKQFLTQRFFTSDLNSGPHIYDWEHKNDDSVTSGFRRFWHFKK